MVSSKDERGISMEEKATVSFAAFESMKTTMERTIKRLWILAIILVLLLAGSNVAWFRYENSFADEVIETYNSQVDGDGGLAIVNRDGSVNYGSTSDIYPNEKENP